MRRSSSLVPLVLFIAIAASGCSGSSTASTPTTTTTTAALVSVTLSTSTIAGGLTVIGTVTLSAVAPTGGAVVTLASSNADAVVPASVQVDAGSTSQTFNIATVASQTSTTATITATYSGVAQSATLTIARLTLQTLSLSAASTTPGQSVTGTLTLAAPAATGVIVALSSTSPNVGVPASVTIPSGSSSQTFDVTTAPSSAETTATITATITDSGSSRTTTLLVAPVELQSVWVGVSTWPGGVPISGLVILNVSAPPAGVTVALTSDSPVAAVPSSVTVPGGASTQTFPITTEDVPPTRAITITGTYGGVTQSLTFTVVALPTIAGVACSAVTVTGGTPVTCSGTLAAAAPAAGWRLGLSSSDPSASVPDAVTVAPSGTTFSFQVSTTAVSANTTVIIRVADAASGSILYSVPLTITTS